MNKVIVTLIIISILGVAAIFIVGGKEYESTWAETENFLVAYEGAFCGIMVAHILISFIDGEQKEKAIQVEKNRLWMERQKEQREIFQKEKDGWIAIKKEGRLIGYVEKTKYDDFVNTNIVK